MNNPIENLKAEVNPSDNDGVILDPRCNIHVVEKGVKIKQGGIEVTDYRNRPVKTGKIIFDNFKKGMKPIVVTWDQAQTFCKYTHKQGVFFVNMSTKFYGKLAEKRGFLDWLITCR